MNRVANYTVHGVNRINQQSTSNQACDIHIEFDEKLKETNHVFKVNVNEHLPKEKLIEALDCLKKQLEEA